MYNVYIRNHDAKIIPDNEISFNKEQALIKHGWQHVWDSAPSIEKAKEYAQEYYRAWVKEDQPYGICRLCEEIPASGMVKGVRFTPEINAKPMAYKGYVCEQCAGGLKDVQWIKS